MKKPEKRSCEFIHSSELIPDKWAGWFWEAITESAPFTWGDSNRTLIVASRFHAHCKEVLNGLPEDCELELQEEDVQIFLDQIEALGDTYLDLEN